MILKQSTAYVREFLMVLATDHVSPATGLTVAVTLSKAGAAFGAAAGAVAEIANGFYSVSLTTADTGTLGDLGFHCTGAGADPTDFIESVGARGQDDLAYPATAGRSLAVDASGQVDVRFLAALSLAAAAFAADTDTYQMKAWLDRDAAGGNDRYVVIYFKNGQPVTSGITSPTIQVIKSSDGTDLVASVALTQIASLGLYKRDEPTNKITVGAGYVIKVTATIDSATRTWYQPISRDA